MGSSPRSGEAGAVHGGDARKLRGGESGHVSRKKSSWTRWVKVRSLPWSNIRNRQMEQHLRVSNKK